VGPNPIRLVVQGTDIHRRKTLTSPGEKMDVYKPEREAQGRPTLPRVDLRLLASKTVRKYMPVV